MGDVESRAEPPKLLLSAYEGDRKGKARVERLLVVSKHLDPSISFISRGKTYILVGIALDPSLTSEIDIMVFVEEQIVQKITKSILNRPKTTKNERKSLPIGIENTRIIPYERLLKVNLEKNVENYEISNNYTVLLKKDPLTLVYSLNGIKDVGLPFGLQVIGESSLAYSKISTLKLPNTLESIEKDAFAHSTELRTIDFIAKSSVAEIGENAFAFCEQMERIDLPASLQTLGSNAFGHCPNLEMAVFPINSQLTKMNGFACSGIVKIRIPSSCESIEPNAFEWTNNLEIVYFGENSNCRTIGEKAFCRSGIQKITIPSSLIKIEKAAFKRSNLKSIEFEENSKLTEIYDYAFSMCKQLENFKLPCSVETIGANAFCDSDNAHIIIPNKSQLKSINKDAFKRTSLSEVLIPRSLTNLERGAFAANNLNMISYPANWEMKIISKFLFCHNNKLTKVEIPAVIEEIDDMAFGNDQNLSSVIIPEDSNLKRINNMAFASTKITSIILPKTLEVIGDGAFCMIKSLEKVVLVDGCMLKSLGCRSFAYSSIVTITFPSKLKEIDQGAFEHCNLLKEINFKPDSELESIGCESFYACDIRELVLPKSLLVIADRAFEENNNLRKVVMPDDSLLESVGMFAFPESLSVVEGATKEKRSMIQYS